MSVPLVPLRRVARLVNGGTPTADPIFWDGSVPWATPVDLAAVDGGRIDRTERSLTPLGLLAGSAAVPAGSIIISTRAPIGYTALTARRMAFNQGCRGVVPAPALVDGAFLRYCFQSLAQDLRAAGTGSTCQEQSTEALANARVPLPQLEEQRRIADLLDDQVALLEAAAQATARMSDQAARRAQVALDRFFDGTGPRPPLKGLLREFPAYGVLVPRFVTEGVPFVRIKDLSSAKTLDPTALPRIPAEQSQEYRRTVLRAGDILFGVVGSTDKVAVVPPALSGANIARAVARLRPREGVPPAVLVGWAQTSQYQDLVRAVTASDTAQPTLNMGDLRNFRVPLPNKPLPALADAVNEWQVTRGNLQHEILKQRHLIEERKRALITACVTGEFDVNAASDRAGDAALVGLPR